MTYTNLATLSSTASHAAQGVSSSCTFPILFHHEELSADSMRTSRTTSVQFSCSTLDVARFRLAAGDEPACLQPAHDRPTLLYMLCEIAPVKGDVRIASRRSDLFELLP